MYPMLNTKIFTFEFRNRCTLCLTREYLHFYFLLDNISWICRKCFLVSSKKLTISVTTYTITVPESRLWIFLPLRLLVQNFLTVLSYFMKLCIPSFVVTKFFKFSPPIKMFYEVVIEVVLSQVVIDNCLSIFHPSLLHLF